MVAAPAALCDSSRVTVGTIWGSPAGFPNGHAPPSRYGSGMPVEAVQSFFALAIGFALAGLLATGYQAATSRPASFRLLQRGPHPTTFAAVPFLVFAAPFIIMRNILRRRHIEGWRFWVVML